MLMNGKKIFDHYYCINSAQTEEIMVYNILQSRHIFIHVKAFILCWFRAEIIYSILACALRGAW